jgi:DnaA N-terminal domain
MSPPPLADADDAVTSATARAKRPPRYRPDPYDPARDPKHAKGRPSPRTSPLRRSLGVVVAAGGLAVALGRAERREDMAYRSSMTEVAVKAGVPEGVLATLHALSPDVDLETGICRHLSCYDLGLRLFGLRPGQKVRSAETVRRHAILRVAASEGHGVLRTFAVYRRRRSGQLERQRNWYQVVTPRAGLDAETLAELTRREDQYLEAMRARHEKKTMIRTVIGSHASEVTDAEELYIVEPLSYERALRAFNYPEAPTADDAAEKLGDEDVPRSDASPAAAPDASPTPAPATAPTPPAPLPELPPPAFADPGVAQSAGKLADARTIFDRAVEHTRALSSVTFDQWFGGVQFDDLTDGVLSLRAQNEFVLEWVKANFLPALTEKIRELTGWSVEVAWTLDQNLTSPVSTMPQSPPVRPRPIVPPAPLRKVVETRLLPPASPVAREPGEKGAILEMLRDRQLPVEQHFVARIWQHAFDTRISVAQVLVGLFEAAARSPGLRGKRLLSWIVGCIDGVRDPSSRPLPVVKILRRLEDGSTVETWTGPDPPRKI